MVREKWGEKKKSEARKEGKKSDAGKERREKRGEISGARKVGREKRARNEKWGEKRGREK